MSHFLRRRNRKPLDPQPERRQGEEAVGYALRLVAWFDAARTHGWLMEELPPLSYAQHQCIIDAGSDLVTRIASGLGLLCCEIEKLKEGGAA